MMADYFFKDTPESGRKKHSNQGSFEYKSS